MQLKALYWNLNTRLLSSYHAAMLVWYAAKIIQNDYIFPPGTDWQGLKFGLYNISQNGMENFNDLTAFMVAYLIVDLTFMLIKRTEKDLWGSTIHHCVGALGMFGFANGNHFHFNGLYYMITEITTPTLNIGWAIIHASKSTTEIGKTLLVVSGAITWILFFFIRFLGSIWLLFMVYYNFNTLLTFDYWEIFVALFGNPVICGLNWYWFYKLTLIVLDKSKPKSNANVVNKPKKQ
jgi:hypothetical protein